LAVASHATRVLIGLFETNEGRHWRWSDGSEVNYAPWALGEPNDFLSDEDCAELHMSRAWGDGYYGMWNDVSCTWPYSAVCQIVPNDQF
ncbi:c-type lectin, partial [Aphelenchoides avenae]